MILPSGFNSTEHASVGVRWLRYAGALVLGALVFCGQGAALAQPQLPEPPIPVDPTPLEELIPVNEKAELSAASEPKKAVEVYLQISQTHLDLAYSTIKSGDHRSAEQQLDIYEKALTRANETVSSMKDKRRSLFKRIEQRIYGQIKRLESIQRLFPPERLPFADAALRHAKQMRVVALNGAFAAGEVLKDPFADGKSDGTKDNQKSGPKKKPGDSATGIPFSRDSSYAGYGAPGSQSMRSRVLGFAGRSPGHDAAQLPGDYLTDEEDNHVREAQSPDDRTKVFMKIADRRLALITGPPPQLSQDKNEKGSKDGKSDKKAQKKAEEEEREWGTLPTVSRAELLRHYARAIEECMGKLDDAYERNPKSSALAKALNLLREATDRHLAILRSLTSGLTEDAESRALLQAIEEAETANKGARSGLSRK